ncbi:MAG: 1,4-dihydroxy-2-naphthoate octaprenyltransferase [Armatimonadetes bacterium]|nr:1,4-dihydroxy-2-naphthoate octaprenyltransferase [Armatimonadota bacterium]
MAPTPQAAKHGILERIGFWVRASRFQFFSASIIPVIVGGAVAYHDTGAFLWGYWLATLVALVLLHAAANLANDYYDHLSRNDEINVEFISPFTGGSRFIQKQLTSPISILIAALLCLAAGSGIGLILVWLRGWPILALGVVGGLSGFFYTADPLRLGYRGLGEIFIFLDFGILPVLGTYYVQTQQFSVAAAAASIPVAFLIAAVLWINQFPDYRADRAVDKKHWVVRLGRRRACYVYAAELLAALLAVPVFVTLGWLPPLTLIALLPLPLAISAIRTAFRHYDQPDKLLPANVGTIVIHLIAGILISMGLIVTPLIR